MGAHPQRFGPYVILDRIGEGGMAEIFLAKMQGYSGFEKLIALKKILPKYSRNHTFAHMLIHEAKLAASLTHFNVVQVYDLGEIDNQVFVAMEYVRGRDLAVVLSNTYRRRERLPLELALFIGTEFLTGLEYAHRLRGPDGVPFGIIHRDISPQNILISYEGEVKVTDFGIARIISEEKGFKLPGNLHGKFGYMSPEQADNKAIDQRSDIFSAGVVLWEMLVGTRLFRGKNQHDTIKLVAESPIKEPSSLNPDVPPEVDTICLKALARDRNQRYQTMGAFLGDLSRVTETRLRRAGTRDLSVYMRRQFGTPGGGFRSGGRGGRSDQSNPSVDPPFAAESPVDRARSPSGMDRVPIGQILIKQGAISVGDLEIGLAEQRAQGGLIGEVLVSSAAIDDTELAVALAEQAKLPAISTDDLVAISPPSTLLSRFPRHAAEASCVLPVEMDSDERVVRLAVCDPYDERGVLEAKVVLGVNDVALLVAPRSAIRAALSRWYQSNGDSSIARGRDDSSIARGRADSSTARRRADSSTARRRADSSTARRRADSSTARGRADSSTARGRADSSTARGRADSTTTPTSSTTPPPPPRVLIADSDPAIATKLGNRIQAEGYEVDIVHDGRAAQSICRQNIPTVALIEAALPQIDGYNLLLEIRAHNQDGAVFLTSERADEFRQSKALELGADDFLVKPLAMDVVVSKVRRELKKRGSGQRSPTIRTDKTSGVGGALEDMTVIDIAQSLELGGKTAHVRINYVDGREGDLRVDRGELKSALTNELQGAEAFYYLARPGIGTFRIEYRQSSQEENIHEPNTFLMIEAMRRLDEDKNSDFNLSREDEASAGAQKSSNDNVNEEDGRVRFPSDEEPYPTGLADDLVLNEASSTGHEPTSSHTAEQLEQWVTEQFNSRQELSDEQLYSNSERALNSTDLARIRIRRLPKPK